jgi:hypothetical protein
MVQQPPGEHLPAENTIRELPLWTRRYAQNRTLGIVVSLLAFGAGYLVMGGLTWLVVLAGRAHNVPLMVLTVTALLGFCGFWVWLCFGGMRPYLIRVTGWLYRHEGEVSLCPTPPTPRPRRQALMAGLVVGFSLLGLTVGAGYVPPQYLQPLTALWAVPFLAGLWWLQRAQMSAVVLLWPALYAVHAVLILAGVPLVFSGSLQGLNVLAPILGYGVLTALIAHLYSRYALRRLRRLAQGADAEGEQA